MLCSAFGVTQASHSTTKRQSCRTLLGFNYIDGMDIMCARNWNISDNVFTGIGGRTGEARGAILIWHNSTDCVIERNIMLDCDLHLMAKAVDAIDRATGSLGVVDDIDR